MTLNSVMTVVLCYFTEFGRYAWGQLCKVVEVTTHTVCKENAAQESSFRQYTSYDI